MGEAIILAGGLGTRLRAVVNDVPKCMAPVAGHPFLYYLLQHLQKYGIRHVILSLGYRHEVVTDWVKCLQGLRTEIDFSVEDSPLGTGGAIRKALTLVEGEDTLVLNGDTFFDVELNRFLICHRQSGLPLSLALKPMEKFERYGNVSLGTNGIIEAFHEKRYCDRGYINGGVYIINKHEKLFRGCPEKFSFETHILQQKVHEGCLNGFVSDGYFIDIGIPEDYERANRDFADWK